MKRNENYIFKDSHINEAICNQLIKENNDTDFMKGIRAKTKANIKELESRKVDVKIIEQWIAAIRSGEYLQERHFLRAVNNDSYFSVLGVLCEITKDVTGGKWNGQWFIPKNSQFTKGFNQDSKFAPEFVMKKLGLRLFSVYYPLGHGQESNNLYFLNEQYNFEELADMIETNYLS